MKCITARLIWLICHDFLCCDFTKQSCKVHDSIFCCKIERKFAELLKFLKISKKKTTCYQFQFESLNQPSFFPNLSPWFEKLLPKTRLEFSQSDSVFADIPLVQYETLLSGSSSSFSPTKARARYFWVSPRPRLISFQAEPFRLWCNFVFNYNILCYKNEFNTKKVVSTFNNLKI